jgi:glutaredoxin
MTKYLLLMTVLVFFICSTANADFYKWEDENGNIHISDTPPPARSGKKVRVYKSVPDSSAATGDEENQTGSQKSKSKKEPAAVILYTKNNCNDCNKAREFFKSKNVIFTEYNIENDKEADRKRKEIDNSDDVPLAIIDKNNVYGFSESIYNRLLKIKP